MNRRFDYDIMQEIQDRWSARALSEQPLTKQDLYPLLEAARYAPSCFNEQPWRFILAYEGDKLDKMRDILLSGNKVWAGSAPAFILILCTRTFALNDKANFWNMFDSGTAWGFLTLEAQRRGLITHAMAGFSKKKARQYFDIPEELEVIALVAIGRYGDPDKLPPDLRERERPNTRMEISELLIGGE